MVNQNLSKSALSFLTSLKENSEWDNTKDWTLIKDDLKFVGFSEGVNREIERLKTAVSSKECLGVRVHVG